MVFKADFAFSRNDLISMTWPCNLTLPNGTHAVRHMCCQACVLSGMCATAVSYSTPLTSCTVCVFDHQLTNQLSLTSCTVCVADHQLQQGESLSRVAATFDIPLEVLLSFNTDTSSSSSFGLLDAWLEGRPWQPTQRRVRVCNIDTSK